MNKVGFNYQVLYFLILFYMVCLIESIDPLSEPVKSSFTQSVDRILELVVLIQQWRVKLQIWPSYMSLIQSVYIFPHAHTGGIGKISLSTCY